MRAVAQWLDLTRGTDRSNHCRSGGAYILTRTHAPLLMGRISARASKDGEVRILLTVTGRYDCPQVHISFALNRCSAMSTNRTAVKPFTC